MANRAPAPRRKGLLTLLGFLLFFLGFLSIVVGMIGLQFQFMLWLDYFGKGIGFAARIFMILVGVILIVLDQQDPDAEL
jgi:predicted small integral membrane protein